MEKIIYDRKSKVQVEEVREVNAERNSLVRKGNYYKPLLSFLSVSSLSHLSQSPLSPWFSFFLSVFFFFQFSLHIRLTLYFHRRLCQISKQLTTQVSSSSSSVTVGQVNYFFLLEGDPLSFFLDLKPLGLGFGYFAIGIVCLVFRVFFFGNDLPYF